MKRKEVYALDKNDDKAIDLFVKLGMPRNLARTLMYISQVDECQCSDIEQAANLRQPEVSIAMQELRRRRWVRKRDQKKDGKGRPVHIYSPTRDLKQILKTVEEEKLKEVETVQNDITQLRQLLGTN